MRILPLRVVVFFAVCLAIPFAAMADHLPESKIARGQPETTLGGIMVDRDSLAVLIDRYGKPTQVKTFPDEQDASRGQRSYIWDIHGLRLRAWTWFRPEGESSVDGIEIWGRSPGTIGRTGRGLALGDNLLSVKKVYGSRFKVGRKSDTWELYVVIQWQQGSEMDIDFDKQGRIVHMLVSAPTE